MSKYDATDKMFRAQALNAIIEEISNVKKDDPERTPDDDLGCYLPCRRETGYVLPEV